MQQAQDVARAVATAQASAPSWGGDAGRFVLMGHSAGAHLVALISASPDIARQQGARPWLGTVALDSAALDTAALMRRRHMPFYDRVFGDDPAYWRTVSPTDTLAPGAPPMLLVCSTQRRDGSCTQANQFATRAAAIGGRAEVVPEDLSHAQIDGELGLPGASRRRWKRSSGHCARRRANARPCDPAAARAPVAAQAPPAPRPPAVRPSARAAHRPVCAPGSPPPRVCPPRRPLARSESPNTPSATNRPRAPRRLLPAPRRRP